MERCGAVVKYRTRNREVAGSIPASTKCRVLETLYPHNLVLVSSREDLARISARTLNKTNSDILIYMRFFGGFFNSLNQLWFWFCILNAEDKDKNTLHKKKQKF